MVSTPLQRLALIVLATSASASVHAAEVSIIGSLTSFQSALSPTYADGNGLLDGVALRIDANLPRVKYLGGDPLFYPQSHTVALSQGTTAVRFEYTDLVGTAVENPNRISFTAAAPAQVNPGETFKVGTLSYTNGYWYPFARIGLSITTSSLDAALNNHSFAGSIVVAVSSPDPYNPADYIANADYFYLQGASGPLTDMGSVRVYESANQPPGNPGNTGSVDLYARIGSLIPTSFENPSGGVFLSQSLEPITSAVPEPVTIAMLLAGLALVGSAAARRKHCPSQT
ncbi:choice-of-anchor K domain-containing protein [Comamonadaceae bacterium G21597-S1]|nr:choice-of-anchor K domain-containing protein [Comamonadaceae bacterium G21597-S1]